MSSPSIILYDIPDKSNSFWSPNTVKARYVLNFKGLPFKTEWLEYPSIADFYKKNNIAHTETTPDGAPHYTLPLIFDGPNNKYVSGSDQIAAYLDTTYPDTPKAFPGNIEGLSRAYITATVSAIGAIYTLVLPKTTPYLNPVSAEYFVATKPPSRADPENAKELWASVKAGFTKLAGWTSPKDTFVLGEKPSFPDFFVGSILFWTKKSFGKDSEEWKDIESWDGGRWAKLLKALEKYE
ncbi:hypothetical protein CYLTODRAFT_431077 [Cylindrobasidium torrendii FP15055 ss-10]|uniref:GST N-terminal domain-containing protein n=1 Tax=Cylindrobasidium torrendii FP15055 ss-10 TaxID=1314674 RepID=A0A0D7BEF5_9AGAR|nr:hypothetical protein CYLTODRAFT_431077 [Cylindrobasidium torrendii FP15055 ss-10]